MFYLVPPAGMPLSLADLARVVGYSIGSTSYAAQFETEIRRLSAVRFCFLTGSGRSALYFILKALSEIAGPAREEVVIPAYTCFTVPASVVKAGLKVRLVDIDPQNLDYDYEMMARVDFSQVLAVIGANMFGILSNWPVLKRMTAQRGVFLIDDAAQSMGSELDGQPSGSLGDVGFFSLGRGKNLTTYSGGIIITDNQEIAKGIEKQTDRLRQGSGVADLVRLLMYSLFLRPRWYWFPDRLSFLGLGETVYDAGFELKGLSDFQRAAGFVLLRKLQEYNQQRTRHSLKLAEKLSVVGTYDIPGYGQGRQVVYLRLPVLAKDKSARDRAIRALAKRGVKATAMYPSTIARIAGIQEHLASGESDFPGSEAVSSRLFTLPTHGLLRERDLETIIECLGKEV